MIQALICKLKKFDSKYMLQYFKIYPLLISFSQKFKITFGFSPLGTPQPVSRYTVIWIAE